MSPREIEGILLDVDHTKGEKSAIQLFVKTADRKLILEDHRLSPYFYIVVNGEPEKAAEMLRNADFGGFKPKAVEIVKKRLSPEADSMSVLKLCFESTKQLSEAREKVKEFEFFKEKREYDIPFVKRYLFDFGLRPMSWYRFKVDEKNRILDITKVEEKPFKPKVLAFDLETISTDRFSDPKKDAIISIAVATPEYANVLTYKDVKATGVVKAKDEAEMFKLFVEFVKKESPEVIATYNGDNFDFPYLKERAKVLKCELDLGLDGSAPISKRKGLDNAVRVNGIQHVDAYQIARMLARVNMVNLVKYDLESVVEVLFGEKKEKLHAEEIAKIWNTNNGIERLVVYNREDAEATLRITLEYLPLLVELSRLVHQTLFEGSRAASSQLVEYLLIKRCFDAGILIPNRPSEEEVQRRAMMSYEGGYVKEPKRGLHENIAVVDFSSLHPTIMISHNVSPDTLDCGHESCKKNVAPSGHYFCTKRKGLIPSTLEELFNKRIELKKRLKTLKKGSHEYNLVNARQLSLKILLNSFYGSMGFPRFRWYSRECAAAVTAWSREYVKMVMEKAEQKGFEPIYGDTDSAFIRIPEDKSRQDVEWFLKEVNDELPGVMNLELEGFYKRGIFVTKRSGEKAAKKRYALIDYNDNLKIVGFEYVRRDWAPIAKNTQRKVIEAVLKEGDPKKAITIVKETIEALKSGKVAKEELVIYTQIKRPLDKYDSIGPHVAAAKKAVAQGKHIEEGSIIGYIITHAGKNISDKAQLEEFVKPGNYDAEYYIHNQVIPAVIKIVRELGYSEEDLIYGGRQASLASFS
jgi:DNA polymerase I